MRRKMVDGGELRERAQAQGLRHWYTISLKALRKGVPWSDLHLKGEALPAVCRITQVEAGKGVRSCYRAPGRGDFTGVIKVKHPEMGRLSWVIWWAQSHCMGPETRRTFPGCCQKTRKVAVWDGSILPLMEGHKPRKAGALPEARKGEAMDSSLESPRRNTALLTP